MLNRSNMHPYQNRGVEYIKNIPYCALWFDMGLGKTTTTATALSDLMAEFEVGRTLIVAPKRVALTTWPMEFKKWSHLRHIRFELIVGNKKERIQSILKKSDVHIISRDNLFWLQQTVGKKWPWETVVLDESSSFKSQSSSRWKAARVIRRHTRRMVQLSATPAPNGLQDLWAQMYLLDQGQRLGATEKAYLERWFEVGHNGYGVKPKAHAKEEIYSLIDDIVVSMKAEDYLEMPEMILNSVEVDLPATAMAAYKKFERSMILELQSGTEVGVEFAAALVNKLLQCANGAVYTDDIKSWEVFHDEKIEALKEIVESNSGYPILVAYNFKSDLERIKRAFPKAVMMDDKVTTQEKWNRGKIPMLLTHPASSGHGLNLQGGSHIIVWFGLNWSLELYKQLNGRLYRQGQKSKTVVIHHIIAKGTVDERVLKVLTDKNATQEELMLAVKAS